MSRYLALHPLQTRVQHARRACPCCLWQIGGKISGLSSIIVEVERKGSGPTPPPQPLSVRATRGRGAPTVSVTVHTDPATTGLGSHAPGVASHRHKVSQVSGRVTFLKKRNRDRGTVEAPAYALYSPGPGDLSLVGGPKRAELPKPKEEQVRRSDCTWPPTLARSW